jgi:hypothetical protein
MKCPKCGFDAGKAGFCPNCGTDLTNLSDVIDNDVDDSEEYENRKAKNRKKWFIATFLIALVILVATALSTAISKDSSDSKSNSSTSSSVGALNISNYKKLSDGMTYEKCCEILGSKGTETFNNKTGGTETKTYNWFEEGKSIYAVFQDNKLVSCGQSGLDN